MKAYADSNFFTRLYIECEWTEGTLRILSRLMAAGTRLPVLWIHRVEIRNAFELFVFAGRTGSGSRVSPEAAAAAQSRFRSECRSSTGPFLTASLDALKWESVAEEISLRHSAKSGFRTYDVLHVAAAKELGCETFYSYDTRWNTLAALEGLDVPLKVSLRRH